MGDDQQLRIGERPADPSTDRIPFATDDQLARDLRVALTELDHTTAALEHLLIALPAVARMLATIRVMIARALTAVEPR